MTGTLDLTTLTPAQVDEAWTEAMQPAYSALARLNEARRTIRRYRNSSYAVEEGGARGYLLERAA